MKFKALVLAMTTATLLAACGGGGSDSPAPSVLATTDTSVAINPQSGTTVVSAIDNVTFSFPSGISTTNLQTTGPSTLTVTAGTTPSFTLSTAQGSASGDLSFGSCIFTVTKLNPNNETNPLFGYLGQTLTVTPCTLSLPTSGKPATGNPTTLTGSLVLEDSTGTSSLNVAITANGQVSINNKPVAKTEVATITGASD